MIASMLVKGADTERVKPQAREAFSLDTLNHIFIIYPPYVIYWIASYLPINIVQIFVAQAPVGQYSLLRHFRHFCAYNSQAMKFE